MLEKYEDKDAYWRDHFAQQNVATSMTDLAQKRHPRLGGEETSWTSQTMLTMSSCGSGECFRSLLSFLHLQRGSCFKSTSFKFAELKQPEPAKKHLETRTHLIFDLPTQTKCIQMHPWLPCRHDFHSFQTRHDVKSDSIRITSPRSFVINTADNFYYYGWGSE